MSISKLASSLKFKMLNVEVRLHWSILLIYVLSLSGGFNLFNLGLATILLVSVLAHEFGHVLMARYYGHTTDNITMMALGGVAAINGDITASRGSAWKAFAIAFAGPAVSIILGAVFLIPGVLLQNEFIVAVGVLNLAVAAFNLFPIFPMDGGRMLHSVFTAVARKLAPRYPKALAWPKKATLVVSVIALIALLGLGIYLRSFTMPLIFVIMAASLYTWSKEADDDNVMM